MLITIKDIRKGRTVIAQDVTMTDAQISDAGFAGAVSCRAELDRIQHRIYVRVRYSCRIHQECSRCLAAFEHPHQGTVTVVLQERDARGTVLAEDADDVDYFFADHDTVVDMRQSLYEDVMVSLPIKPLCTPGCPGIGYTNEPNRAAEKVIDPRWEALKRIKE